MSFKVPTDFASRPVAVIGAGTLGRRIALMFAAHGAEVKIYDLAEEQRNEAVDYVSKNLPTVTDGLTGVAPGLVSAEADLAQAIHDAWLVVEAIPERLELKKQVFGQLDELAAADAILASNSSSYASRMFLEKVSPPRARAEHPLLYAAEAECGRRDVLRQDRPRRDRLRHGDAADSGFTRSKHAGRAPDSSSTGYGRR